MSAFQQKSGLYTTHDDLCGVATGVSTGASNIENSVEFGMAAAVVESGFQDTRVSFYAPEQSTHVSSERIHDEHRQKEELVHLPECTLVEGTAYAPVSSTEAVASQLPCFDDQLSRGKENLGIQIQLPRSAIPHSTLAM